ncbi:MAG: 30S ribosome-binding factor RbfA [Gammaproteobacteria bacterium]|jgi:ribosome-binding factor A|nr:30S ribosome-binding factor RbfA [Gammaproteobacteria bacterium]
MARVSKRVDKVADLLKKEIALLIQGEVRDPRVGMASVTGVKVSRDLAHASVYVTLLGKTSAEEIQEGIDALNKAAGFLRSLLAKTISLRTTPKLSFIYDDSLARGQFMTDLIDEALARDERDHHIDDDDSEK